MAYKVKKQFERRPEIFCESFKQLADAKKFVDEKISEDVSLNVKVIYRIYDAIDEVTEEFDSSTYKPATSSSSTDQASSQGAGKSASFRPSPLGTAPRPAGMPQNWRVDDEDKKDKEK